MPFLKSRHETAIEDRLPFAAKLLYGIGQFCNNLLAAALGCMSIVLNLGLGMNPAWVGTILSVSRFTDALTDPIMGYVSDHSQTRWGRRRPYILAGAILSGLIFALMWQIPAGHSQRFYILFFMIGTNLFYVAYTIFATPFIAFGYELTPDYHERTRLMGFSNFMGQFAWLAVPWFYAIMENKRLFENSVQGARSLAIAVGIFVLVAGTLPALLLKERFFAIARAEEQRSMLAGIKHHIAEFFKGLLQALRFTPFLRLCAATFLVFNGFMAISGFSSYVIIYYLCHGNKELGSVWMGWYGSVSSLCTFCVIALVTWLSTKIGKRPAFFLSMAISIVGYGLKWFLYQPGRPALILLSAPLISFGLGSLFTVMGAMMADVCDLDELKHSHRREGTFGAIYWWMVKLGMSVAFAVSGFLLNSTGFDVNLGAVQAERTLFLLRVYDIGVPIATSLLAIIVMIGYPITEDAAYEFRAELEKRRGKALWARELDLVEAAPTT